MQIQRITTLSQQPVSHKQGSKKNDGLQYAIVTELMQDDSVLCNWQNDKQALPFIASRAFSCLLKADINDLLLIHQQDDHCFFLAILSREQQPTSTSEKNNSEENTASLSLPGLQAMKIESRKLTLSGHKDLQLQSQHDVSITALNTIKLTASNLFTTLSQSLIQLAQHHIIKASQIALTASQLLRSHGHHHLITADEDVKIDGERINMG